MEQRAKRAGLRATVMGLAVVGGNLVSGAPANAVPADPPESLPTTDSPESLLATNAASGHQTITSPPTATWAFNVNETITIDRTTAPITLYEELTVNYNGKSWLADAFWTPYLSNGQTYRNITNQSGMKPGIYGYVMRATDCKFSNGPCFIHNEGAASTSTFVC